MSPYKILDGVKLEDLEAEVAQAILDGYVPIGGIFFFHENPCQAVVLKDLSGWIDDKHAAIDRQSLCVRRGHHFVNGKCSCGAVA